MKWFFRAFSSAVLMGTAVSVAALEQEPAVTIIHAGELLAVPGEKPLENQTVVIENGVVKSVLGGFADIAAYGETATLVDLSTAFVMPGLMDMHVHIQGQRSAEQYKETVRWSNEDYGMRSVMFARKTLMAGFTTVRDLGAEPTQLYALRDAIERGWIDGPRIIASGGVAATGGHGDVDGMRHELLDIFTPKTLCDGPYECRKAVRTAIKYGANVIKITATGGVLSDTTTGVGQQMTDDELKEIMDTAHALGIKVAAHAHDAGGINAALRAGVDSIEHGSYADKESIHLFRKNGAYLVPTLLAGNTVVKLAKTTNMFSPAIKAKALKVGADMISNFKASYNGGVKIAYGTDSGVSVHGTNAEEALLMLEAGMTPMDILKSATVSAADLIGMSDSLGTIEAGKKADIIATAGSALDDMNELLDVDFVMKGGKVIKNK